MRLMRIAAVFSFVFATASCATLLQSDSLLRGTIVGVGSDSMDVRHKSGQIVRVVIAPTTAVVSNTQPGTTPRLRLGLRTNITLEESSRPFIARQVRVFGDSR